MVNVVSMKLSQLLTKLFGYVKTSSLVFIIILGIYGVATKKGDLSIWAPEKTLPTVAWGSYVIDVAS